jgi:hypothetical protein
MKKSGKMGLHLLLPGRYNRSAFEKQLLNHGVVQKMELFTFCHHHGEYNFAILNVIITLTQE